MRWLPFAWLWLVLCGALAGSVVGALGITVDDAGLREQPYRLMRSADDPYLLSPARWLLEPHRYGDFDLHMTVELGERTALDVLVRQVEPREVRGQVLPFHGRFQTLRLSTAGAGPAWLDRTQALFGDRMRGHELAPGIAATVWIQARGALLRANVAGTWLPWQRADDEYGMLTLIARGGDAVIRQLVIEPRPMAAAWRHARSTWVLLGAVLGALCAAVGSAFAAAAPRLLAAGLLLALGVVWSVGKAHVPELQFAGTAGRLALLATWTVLAAAVAAWPRRWTASGAAPITAAIVLVVAGLLHSGGQRWLAQDTPSRLAEERRLDEVFGPAAGNTLAEALAQRVRGTGGIYSLAERHGCVFLLGGQLLYSRGGPDEHLDALLSVRLHGPAGERIFVPCLPTVDGYSQQQWRMFDAFYRDYRPSAIVFGVGSDEAAVDARTGQPRSDAAALRRTLAAAREYAAGVGSHVVLFTEEGLPDELLAVLQEAAQQGVPLVVAKAQDSAVQLADRLAAAVMGALGR